MVLSLSRRIQCYKSPTGTPVLENSHELHFFLLDLEKSFSISHLRPENLWKYQSGDKQKYQFLKFLARIVVVVSKPEIKRKKFLLFSKHKTERKKFLFWSQSMRLKDRNSRSRLETRDWNKFLLLSQSTGEKEICILISKHKTERKILVLISKHQTEKKKFLFSSRRFKTASHWALYGTNTISNLMTLFPPPPHFLQLGICPHLARPCPMSGFPLDLQSRPSLGFADFASKGHPPWF